MENGRKFWKMEILINSDNYIDTKVVFKNSLYCDVLHADAEKIYLVVLILYA